MILLPIQTLGILQIHQRDSTKTSKKCKAINSNPNPRTHIALETLVEETISLQNPEVAHDIADFPNLMKAEEVLGDQ